MKVSIKEIFTAIAIIAILAVAHYFLPYRIASAFSARSASIHFFAPFILGGLILLSIVVFFVLKAKKRPCPQFLKKALVLIPIALVVIVPISYHCSHNHKVAFYGSNYGVLYGNFPDQGITNQWGKVIVEPDFNFINIAYDNSSNKTVFICCNVNKIENSSIQTAYRYKMFFSILTESGEVIENREGYLASSGSTVREYLEERYSNIKPLGNSEILNYTDGENDYLQIEFLDANIGDTQICDTNASSSTSDNRSSSNSSSSSNNNNSSHSEQPQPRQPERHETQVPFQVWKDCGTCWGSGKCQYCHGDGYIVYISGEQDCSACIDGKCSICAGKGGHYEVEYKTRVDYY